MQARDKYLSAGGVAAGLDHGGVHAHTRGDGWPMIRTKMLQADIFVLATRYAWPGYCRTTPTLPSPEPGPGCPALWLPSVEHAWLADRASRGGGAGRLRASATVGALHRSARHPGPRGRAAACIAGDEPTPNDPADTVLALGLDRCRCSGHRDQPRLARAARLGALEHESQWGNLLLAAMQIWVTKVIGCALLYWELHRGCSVARRRVKRDEMADADWRFSQEENDDTVHEVSRTSSKASGWVPIFVDYLSLSVTNSSAFSPTDSMPLTSRAKVLMAVQATAALVTSQLVVARAVGSLVG